MPWSNPSKAKKNKLLPLVRHWEKSTRKNDQMVKMTWRFNESLNLKSLSLFYRQNFKMTSMHKFDLMGQDVWQPLEADENLLAYLGQVKNFSLFTAYHWCDSYSTSINTYEVWEIKSEVQVFRRKFYTYIHLD